MTTTATRIILVGHGKMGRLIESLAPSYGCVVAGIVTEHSGDAVIKRGVGDVAIDFSQPSAVRANVARAAEAGMSIVLGTTGWQAHETELRAMADTAGIGVI